MDSEKIIISTTLSNVDISLYDEYGVKYNNEIICKYLKSDNDQMINNVFSQFIDSVYFANNYSSLSELIKYKSTTPFYVRYNISLGLKEFSDLIFNNCQMLSSIINIGDNFKRIGKYAFNNCSELKYIDIPKSIREIDMFAFNGTDNLKSINILNVTTLHNYALAGSGIESIELNNNIDTLNHYLFKDCRNLKEFKNDHIKKICEGVFCGCNNLKYVQISDINISNNGSDEYKEETEDTPVGFISVEYEVSIFIDSEDSEIGYVKIGDFRITTIENLIKDGNLSKLVKFKIIERLDSLEDSEYLPLIGDSFYVEQDMFEDKYHVYFTYYDEGGTEMRSKITLKVEDVVIPEEPEKETETESEPTPISNYELYDHNDRRISNITKELADRILEYKNSDDEKIAELEDLGNGTGKVKFKYPLPIHEYYNDGITPTGKIFEDFSEINSMDPNQSFSKYILMSSETINDDNDINSHLVFSDDFSYIKIKLNGFPVYDPTQTYIIYTLYEPFLSLRLRYDTNLIPIESLNNQAFIDYGFHKIEPDKWPVYNTNFCFIGLNSNDNILLYTNKAELERYQSRIEEIEIFDNDGNPTGLKYFILPQEFHYNEFSISTEESRQIVIDRVTEIIESIINATSQTEENITLEIEYDVNNQGDIQLYSLSNIYSMSSYEEEEEINQLSHIFNIHELSYKNSKIPISNYLFAGCVNLSNDDIVRAGNYIENGSNTIITFTNNLVGKYYIGQWKDYVKFRYYNPGNVNYEYIFKWKVIKSNNIQYIQILLNDKIYYITEEFDNTQDKYIRKFINNIGQELISDILDISNNLLIDIDQDIQLDKTSLFNVIDKISNINNQNTHNISVTLPNYQKSIYDKYPFLDIIDVIGKGSFMNCSSIKNINNQFTTINEFGFKDCINLESIDLSNTTKIGNYAFMNCKSLKEIDLSKLETNIAEGIFNNCENLETVSGLKLNYVTRYLFKNCYKLNNINLNNVTEIAKEAFFNCYNLILNDSNNISNASIIGDFAFCNCKSISKLIFKDNIRSIGTAAFKGCSNLTEVILPNTISEFSKEMFHSCTNLQSITFSTPYVSSKLDNSFEVTAIDYCNKLKTIHIPNGGRYTTPNDNCIYNTSNKELVYVCKDIQTIKITSDIELINPLAFNNSNVSIIEIDPHTNITNLTSETFSKIKNKNYHILINKNYKFDDNTTNEDQYYQYLELVGKRHIYYK